MKNKKGFTLIELLAVIVILAIIALIAVPIVLRIIESSRESAAVRSAELYLDGVEKFIAKEQIKSPSTESGNITLTVQELKAAGLKISGEEPTSGTITLSNKGVVTNIEGFAINGYNIVMDENGNLKIGNAEPIKLPDGYKQLEYIESTGTQYIDTGIKGGLDTLGVDFKFNVSVTANNKYYVLGNFNQTGQCGLMRNTTNNTDVILRYYIGSSSSAINIGLVNTDIVFSNKDNNITVNNVNKGVLPNNTSKLSNSNLYIYGTGTGTPFNSGGKIYYLKVYSDLSQTKLIGNFIPVKNSSNVVGMYDTVTKTFYRNAGTGTFTAGPEIFADYIDFTT